MGVCFYGGILDGLFKFEGNYLKSHFIQRVKLRQAPPMECYMEIKVENLGTHHWESHWNQKVEK